MPDLSTYNHELFARSYLHTDNAAYAYRHAYGENIDPNDALTLGASIMEIPEVAARIKELQDERYKHEFEFPGISEKRAFLANLMRTPICNIDANSKLCHSVKRTYGKDGALISEEFKVPDKFRAFLFDQKLAELQENEAIQSTRTISTLEEYEKELNDGFEERLAEARK